MRMTGPAMCANWCILPNAACWACSKAFEGTAVGTRTAAALPLSQRMDAFEREAILQAISEARGEIGKAIEALGLARETFYYRVKKLGIDLTRVKGRKPRASTR